jgi:hypothetical protein
MTKKLAHLRLVKCDNYNETLQIGGIKKPPLTRRGLVFVCSYGNVFGQKIQGQSCNISYNHPCYSG